MSDDDIQFIDAEQHLSKEDFSFRFLVLQHLGKISQLCVNEFRAGYWQKKPVSIAGGLYMSEIYIDDKRDAYINAVDFLHDALLPSFDKTMLADVALIDKEQREAREVFHKEGREASEWIDQKLVFKRRLFQKLSLLLKRLNYLEGGRHNE